MHLRKHTHCSHEAKGSDEENPRPPISTNMPPLFKNKILVALPQFYPAELCVEQGTCCVMGMCVCVFASLLVRVRVGVG